MTTKVSSGGPEAGGATGPDGGFFEAAKKREAHIATLTQDVAADGHMSPLESAMLQKRIEDYARDLEAYQGALQAYSDALDKIVGNIG